MFSVNLPAQDSPHGDKLGFSCTDCHNTSGWKVDLNSFNHNSTNFLLVGQHQTVSCKDCHSSLVFDQAGDECKDCHVDMHQQTVGLECDRCHTPNSWVVNNVTQLHQMSRFPLVGAHSEADCGQCHTNLISASVSASFLRFDPLGIECIDCHRDTYLATTNPNHIQSNFSTNCIDCHKFNSYAWLGSGINHDFFPLTGVHEVNNCTECHTTGSFGDISAECVSCHQSDYNATSNPNHSSLNFSTQCKDCHTLSPGWKPAEYREHDVISFPIYSGEHNGEWNSCADCHTNTSNYSQFTCIDCHEHNRADSDEDHGGVAGYEYSSPACFACHPLGTEEGAFNHNISAFPLTGAHTSVNCSDCHTAGYDGTSDVCSSCHTNDYTQTTNPNHVAISISNDCALCHSTIANWEPATFPVHNNYYLIEGAHLSIANDCFTCHQGDYNTAINSCYDCHASDYNQTSDPAHSVANFPTICEDCHSQNAWTPSTFNHDGLYFPIYSGRHNNEWNTCSECHTDPGNFTVFTCTTSCHPQSETDNDHQDVNAYTYLSSACLSCHPTGSSDKSFQKNIYRSN
jgi:hypothetical protein